MDVDVKVDEVWEVERR
jgi:hypothetical protein